MRNFGRVAVLWNSGKVNPEAAIDLQVQETRRHDESAAVDDVVGLLRSVPGCPVEPGLWV
jgi:hypothetical protein